MEIPSEWWSAARDKLHNPAEAETHLERLLKEHPDPARLVSYLNERRFTLLLRILEQSECLRKFLFRHPTEFEKTMPGLWYVSKEKEDYLLELKKLLSDDTPEERFSEKLAYYRHRELLRVFAKDLLRCARTEDILREYSCLADAA